MDHLRCKTPHRVHNEFYMHMLAYNLIRKTIAIAAAQRSVLPYQISFKGALQTRMNFLASLHVDTDLDQWCIRLLSAIASEEIGNRPDRVEPRVKKRRPKPYDAMTKPRSEYKKAYRRRTYIKGPVPFGSDPKDPLPISISRSKAMQSMPND